MNTRNLILVISGLALVSSLIGGVVSGFIGLKARPLCIEPHADYVYTFKADQLKDPEHQKQAFINALSYPGKVKFRHNMAIGDGHGNCDQTGLEDVNIIGTSQPCSGPLTGMHVTQRAGFNNRADLNNVLNYLTLNP